ncbi:MAG TPA: pilus assembly protein [Anaerolineaceae bacterium]|jgi:hypothetical protein|nr:pilus assembly protein [Anaerolineaceae bacterium]
MFKSNPFLQDRTAMETLEAVITTPMVVILMLAIVNLGLLVYGQQAVQAAARHGARMGSVAQGGGGAGYASASARQAIQDARLVQNPAVTILSPGGSAGSLLSVRVSGEIPNFMAGMLPGLPDPFVVSADAIFRQEGW